MRISEPGAPNLDAMTQDDLMTFWVNAHRGSRLTAEAMFPDNRNGRVRALKGLGNYASNKATAMRCRLAGDIPTATMYEEICDRIYSRLPKWARW